MHNAVCPHCNHEFECQGQEFRHRLTKGLVGVLVKMAAESKARGFRSIEIRWDGGILQGSELGNYTKLKHFRKMIIKDPEAKGKWIVTDRGFSFLRGLYAVPEHVTTKNGSVVAESRESVTIHDFAGRFKERWQTDFIEDLARIEREKSPDQLSLTL